MQAFAVTFSGMQPTASIECQELIGTHSDQNDFGILFDSAPSSIARFAYHSQSAVRVLISPIFFDSENINSAHANSRLFELIATGWVLMNILAKTLALLWQKLFAKEWVLELTSLTLMSFFIA